MARLRREFSMHGEPKAAQHIPVGRIASGELLSSPIRPLSDRWRTRQRRISGLKKRIDEKLVHRLGESLDERSGTRA